MTWAEWTKRGLVDRYEVPPDKVVVIPPGVHYDAWASRRRDGSATTTDPSACCSSAATSSARAGCCSSSAIRRLRDEGLDVELDLVTARRPGRRARGDGRITACGPNSPELIALYRAADVFCLPTFGDCLPMVLSEAGAVGLPLVATDVGAISEIVRDERDGAAASRSATRTPSRRRCDGWSLEPSVATQARHGGPGDGPTSSSTPPRNAQPPRRPAPRGVPTDRPVSRRRAGRRCRVGSTQRSRVRSSVACAHAPTTCSWPPRSTPTSSTTAGGRPRPNPARRAAHRRRRRDAGVGVPAAPAQL